MTTKAENEKLIEATVKHKTANFLTEFRMEFTEHKTELALMKKDIESIKEGISELKNIVKEWFAKADEKFATKDEHKQNKEAIEKINKIFFWLGTLVVWAIVVAILNLVLKW